jgi:MFS family permease
MASYGQIGSDLKALNLTSWIATSYFLTLTSFQPLYGKLSDIFGRKPCLLFAYAIFGIGCLFCGLARNINELIAARVCLLFPRGCLIPWMQKFTTNNSTGLPRHWWWRYDHGGQYIDE